MINEQQEENFIELYSFEQKKYSEIETELNVDRKRVQELYDITQARTEAIQKVRTKFTTKRKEAFNNNFKEFYNWYKGETKECAYCGISQESLTKIFQEERILPLNEATKRSSGSLEIERRDSTTNSYGKDNIILACPLCNNAKSNLIDEQSWKDCFVPAMKKYYAKLLKNA